MGQNRVAKKNREYNKKNKGKRIYNSKHIRRYENIKKKVAKEIKKVNNFFY